MKIVTVTGCAGFIGGAFTERLLSLGYYVHGIDSLTRVADKTFMWGLKRRYPKHFNIIVDNIVTIEEIPDCDILFNFAAESDVDSSNNNSRDFIQTNIAGVENLLALTRKRATIKVDPPIFIQISTDEVYGNHTSATPYNETQRLKPCNPYAASKAGADLLIESWDATHGLDYKIIRPSNTYGLRQFPEKLIPLVVKNLCRDKKINLHNMGLPVRTWTHAQDVIDGILLATTKGVNKETYNISSNEERTNEEMVKVIIDLYYLGINLDYSKYINYRYDRPGQDMHYSICSDKIRQLGWKPQHKLAISLMDVVAHYKENVKW